MSFDLPALPEGWSYAALDSCCHKGSITYGIVQPGSPVNEGVPIVRVNNFRDTRLDLHDVMRVAPDVEAKYGRTRLKGGEVLLTIVGSVGQVAVAPASIAGFNVARAVAVIEPLPHVSADWIALCLRSPLSQHLLGSRANTTVQTTINLKDLRALPIPLPPANARRKIETLIGALDDRITLLRETNATLEAIAQALFKSWFVDFDPVRAKMEGRQPEGMDEETAALFPDSFEESELGEIPQGWEQRTFRQTIDILGGGTPKTSNLEYWNGHIPWFSIVDAPRNTDVFVMETEKRITEAGLNGSSAKILPRGTTIITARGTVGKLALTGRPMAMNQSCYGLRGRSGDDYFTFFSTARLVQQLQQKAHGSVFDTITQDTLSGVMVKYPSVVVIAAFEKAIEPLMLRIRANLTQAKTLSTLRDSLLPRLISGQISLPESAAETEPAQI